MSSLPFCCDRHPDLCALWSPSGMGMSQGAAADVANAWPMLPVALFRSSLLLWQVGQALYGPDVVGLPLTAQIHVHPLAVSHTLTLKRGSGLGLGGGLGSQLG